MDVAPRKDKVLSSRVSERQRVAYERAAAIEGTTVTAFVTGGADRRAEEVLVANNSLRVASDVFDELLAALDAPVESLPWMEEALSNPRFTNP